MLIDALLPEFDREMGLTRRVLERVPDDQFEWRPHPTSLTLGRLAEHLTEMPQWAALTMSQDGIDTPIATPDGHVRPSTRSAVLARFDANLVAARPTLVAKTDAQFNAPWTLRVNGNEMFTMPKAAVMRNFVLNHMIHHRGQLLVYLRMLGVPVPSIYGPSADEQI